MSPSPTTLVVPAPAKVNLFLHVTGRRADGYHLLDSLFALVDWCDVIRLDRREDGAIVRTRSLAGVPEDADLAVRAARLLQAATANRYGVDLAVEKRLPLGGGLGGGSSDAASVLIALNHLWGAGLSRGELAALGLELGADVPFFVHGHAARVRGIGEIVEPVSLPRQWLALAIPPVAVPTAAIFAAPELTRSTPSAKINVFSEGYGCNDLEPVARQRYPAVAVALAALADRVGNARMTGSGACAIALCGTEAAAREAVQGLPAGTVGRVVRTLERHPLAALA